MSLSDKPKTGEIMARDYLKTMKKHSERAAEGVLPKTVTVTAISGNKVAVREQGSSTSSTEYYPIAVGPVSVGSRGMLVPSSTSPGKVFVPLGAEFANAAHNHDDRYFTEAEVNALIISYKPRVKRTYTGGATISTAGNYALTSGSGPITFSGLIPSASYEVSWSVTLASYAFAAARVFLGVQLTTGTTTFLFGPATIQSYPGGVYDVTSTWGHSATVTADASGNVVITPAVQWVSGTTEINSSDLTATISRA